MTIIETMVVIALIGILSALAVPGMQALIGAYIGKAAGAEVLFAVRAGRDFAQKYNAVTQVRTDGQFIVIEKQGHDSNDLIKPLTGTWVEEHRYKIDDSVTFINFPTQIYFCASPEGRYRLGSTTGTRVCAIGSVSQTSAQDTPTPPAIIEFKVREQQHTITVTSALGNATMRRGS